MVAEGRNVCTDAIEVASPRSKIWFGCGVVA